LRLYCDLLSEKDVLSEEHRHFAYELQAIAGTSTRLVERMSALHDWKHSHRISRSLGHSSCIDDLTAAVEHLKGPLSVLAGRKVALEMECLPCYGRIALSPDSLTRILINLTRNAAEAMPHGGRIRITVQQGGGGSFFDFLDEETTSMPKTALICVQDSGTGIANSELEHIFDAGFTRNKKDSAHRGLGLNIVRRLVEAAGGSVRAVSVPRRGARFEVELPLIGRTGAKDGFVADFSERANIEC
jgi:signal transduction histidine kinase